LYKTSNQGPGGPLLVAFLVSGDFENFEVFFDAHFAKLDAK